MKRVLKKSSRFVVLAIVSLLCASGVLRFGVVGIAIASGDTAAQAGPSSAEVNDPQLADLLNTVKGRAAELAAWQAELETQSRDIEAARAAMAQKLAELQAAEASLKRTVALVDSAAEDDVDRLVAVYQQMKPKTAAPLFEQMQPNFAAGFLARMRPDASAAIMASLPAEHAYAISVILAGRNANAPTR